MEYQTITVEKAGKTGVLTLNRPDARNALSILMRREISRALEEMKGGAGIEALVITGAGNGFCAGFDLKEFTQSELREEIVESSRKYHHDLWEFPKPVVAAINGAALGGGFDLATLCDIRICSGNASFAHPEIKFGGPPLFTPLRWIIGHGLARDLCLTGRKIGAEDALRMGLVSEVVAEGAAPARAIEIARVITEAPAAALAVTKSYMISNAGINFGESFALEHDEPFNKFLLNK